jgi:tetratricopeptide (TPR) repeat protein
MTAIDERSKATELEAAERALSEAEQQQGKDSPALCEPLQQLAGLYHRDGLYAKAELLLRRAVDILTKGGTPAQQVQALSRLGMLYRTEGKLDDAESVYLRLLAAAEQLENSARLRAERLCCLAGVYAEKKEFAQCEEVLKKAAAAYQAAFGQQSCYSRLCCMALAVVCQHEGKTGEADGYFERSRTDVGPAGKDEHGEERALLELVQNYYAQGRYGDTDILLSQSLYSDEQQLWPDHPQAAEQLHMRGELFRAQGRFEDAERCFKQALDIRQRTLGPAHPEVAESAMSLATMYMSQNRCGDAEPALKIALKTRVRAFGAENPAVAACIETYAALLKRTKRGAIASKLEARARDIRTRLVWNADRA